MPPDEHDAQLNAAQESVAGASEAEAERGIFDGAFPIRQALEKLRNRLLDLSNRNRLLNYRHPRRRSAQVVNVDLNGVFRRLVDGKECRFRWVPEPGPLEYRGQRPDARTWAEEHHGIAAAIELGPSRRDLPANDSSANTLWVLQYPPELTRLLHNIARDARLAIEETGTNMLHLVFGFLEFYDAAHSEKPLLAPLIAVPVSLRKKGAASGYDTYDLAHTGDDIRENLTLREKLKHDFNINLPVFDDDQHGDDAEVYLEGVAEIIRNRPNWKVKRQVTLAMLSFGKPALWAELDPEKWPGLLEHQIVKNVFQGNTRDFEDVPSEVKVDELESFDELIHDADGSQHGALVDVLSGRTLVINGPPGTGKSQTITNIIASSVVRGKSVLFVAEKLAALEVVKSRLHDAELGDFCLELHSHKTQKKRLLEDIDARMHGTYQSPTNLSSKRKSLLEKRGALGRYAETLNMVTGNELGMTIFDVLWAADRRRAELGQFASNVEQLTLRVAPSTRPDQLEKLGTVVEGLSRHYVAIRNFGPGHPWFGFFPSTYPAGLDLQVKDLLDGQSSVARDLHAEINSMREELKLTGSDSNGCRYWVDIDSAIRKLGAPPDVPSRLVAVLFSPGQTFSVEAVLEELRIRIDRVSVLERQFKNKVVPDVRIDERDFSAARLHVQRLEDIGLAQRRLAEIRELPHALRTVAGQVRRTCDVLREMAEIAGLPWEGTARDVAHLRDVMTIARNAPMDLLAFRRRSFETPGVRAQLAKARKQALELGHVRARLNESFYIDPRPNHEEMHRAIQALRQGDGLLRWISGKWRRARILHIALSRVRVRRPAQERAEDLLQLASLFEAETAFNANPEYSSLFGELFSGLTTDWARLDQLATWFHMSQQVLIESQVPAPSLDLTATPAPRLGQLKARHHVFEARTNELEDVRKTIAGKLGESILLSDAATRQHKSWTILIGELGDIATAIEEAVQALSSMAHPECTPSEAIRAIQACLAHPKALEEVRQYELGQRLLGEYFAGLDTNLQLAGSAYSWGRRVMESTLPETVKDLLVRGPDPVRTYARVSEGARRIVSRWESMRIFDRGMAEFGEFRAADWLGEPADEPTRIAARSELARNNLDGLLAWSQYNGHRREAVRLQLVPFVERLEDGKLPPASLALAFEFSFFNSIAVSLFHSRPELASFSATAHEQIRAQFADLDREIIKLTGSEFASRIARNAKVPQGGAGYSAADFTEKQLLVKEINKQKRHIPIRQLLKRAGKAIQAYKPCFMMSPLSVAYYLEPEALAFDLVVMDEASQIRPEDALGAVGRGAQIVVVGDPKQLPPSSFFDRMAGLSDDDDEEDVTTDSTRGTESILDVFQQLFPSRSLNWHYRSRHQSLIAFSNRHFYDNKLVVFPSPYPNNVSLGLHYHYIANGNYAGRQNLPEAIQVVDAVINHMLVNPGQSLGVVTLAITQRDLIEMLFEKKSKSFPQVQKFLSDWDSKDGHKEPFFIKNLENVQGDERDLIYISTTFGSRDGTGPVAQNFGPISKQGGWRRLNVLFTRAKQGVRLFTSMRPEDIVIDQRTPDGTRALRNYIEYARSGVLEGADPSERAPDSDFEVSVADALRERGLEVVPQLGVAGFFIDLAVRNPHLPGEYLAAIECDGASYHSGASVRDRDRIRQEILEGLGWKDKIFRIWSTDWYRNRGVQTTKLLAFLEARLKHAAAKPKEAPQPVAFSKDEIFQLTPPQAVADATELQSKLLQESSDEVPFVEVGDTVAYILTAHPRDRKIVRIIEGPSNPAENKLNHEAPVAAALLGLEIDGEEELIVDGRRLGLPRKG